MHIANVLEDYDLVLWQTFLVKESEVMVSKCFKWQSCHIEHCGWFPHQHF